MTSETTLSPLRQGSVGLCIRNQLYCCAVVFGCRDETKAISTNLMRYTIGIHYMNITIITFITQFFDLLDEKYQL